MATKGQLNQIVNKFQSHFLFYINYLAYAIHQLNSKKLLQMHRHNDGKSNADQEIPPNQDEMDAKQDEPDYQDDNDEDDVEIIEIYSDTEDDEMVNELPFWAIPRRKHTTNLLQYSSIGCDISGHVYVTNNGQAICQTCMIRFN